MATTFSTRRMQMTARFYAEMVASLLARQHLDPGERDQLIDEIRQLAQFAADHDALPTITKSEPALKLSKGPATRGTNLADYDTPVRG